MYNRYIMPVLFHILHMGALSERIDAYRIIGYLVYKDKHYLNVDLDGPTKGFCIEDYPYFSIARHDARDFFPGSHTVYSAQSYFINDRSGRDETDNSKEIRDQKVYIYIFQNVRHHRNEYSLRDWINTGTDTYAWAKSKLIEEAKAKPAIFVDALNVNVNDTPSSNWKETDCARIIKITTDTDPPMLTIKIANEPQEITIPASKSLTIVYCTGFTKPDSNNNVWPIYKKVPYTNKTTFETNMNGAIYDKKVDEKLTQTDHSVYVVYSDEFQEIVNATFGLKKGGGARRKSKKVKKSSKTRKSRKSIKNRKTKYSKK